MGRTRSPPGSTATALAEKDSLRETEKESLRETERDADQLSLFFWQQKDTNPMKFRKPVHPAKKGKREQKREQNPKKILVKLEISGTNR